MGQQMDKLTPGQLRHLADVAQDGKTLHMVGSQYVGLAQILRAEAARIEDREGLNLPAIALRLRAALEFELRERFTDAYRCGLRREGGWYTGGNSECEYFARLAGLPINEIIREDDAERVIEVAVQTSIARVMKGDGK